MPKRIALLGATGSIGGQVVELVEAFPDRFQLVALASGRNADALAAIAARHPHARLALREGDARAGFAVGEQAVNDCATHPDARLVVMAIGGAASLAPTLAALQTGKDVALASKEAMVTAGDLVTAAARATGSRILPVDSEHSAIWQCRWGEDPAAISSITLTGSGGPFRTTPLTDLENVSVEDALRHPTWSMGRKITIDSATMMNKALEVIELHHLFDIAYERIKVVIHPQSIVHGMVALADGTTRAVLANPDMRIPIATALAYPERLDWEAEELDLARVQNLEFADPDPRRYPAIALGFAAGRRGGTAPAVLNAANEAAVEMFLDGRIRFDRIVPVVEAALEAHETRHADSIDAIAEADAWARRHVEQSFVSA